MLQNIRKFSAVSGPKALQKVIHFDDFEAITEMTTNQNHLEIRPT